MSCVITSSFTTSIILTSLNLSTSLCNFLLNTSTSILTHEFVIRSCQCGAVSRITFVWLASVRNIIICFRPSRELFFAMSLEPPYSTTTSFLVSRTFASAVSLMVFIPAPGLVVPKTSKSLLNKCFTSAAHPLAWLSPKIITLCCF